MSSIENPEFNVESARRYNAKAADTVGWRDKIPEAALGFFPNLACEPHSSAFAMAVLALQVDLGFGEDDRDGKLGRGTWRATLSKFDPVSDSDRYILHDGVRIAIPDRGQSYKLINLDQPSGINLQQHGHFSKGRRPDRPLSYLVWHWGSSSAHRLASILENKGISTHFAIELSPSGEVLIFQYVDTIHRAWHAASANSWSVGIDFCQQPTEKWYRRLKDRGGLVELVKNPSGRGDSMITTLDLRLEKAGQEFAYDLCMALGIEHRIPRGQDGMATEGEIFYGVLSKDAIRGGFKGMMPHSAITPKKWDIAPWWIQLFGDV